jgi:hypothetical protein
MNYLTEYLSGLMTPQLGLSKPKETLSEADLKRVIKYVNRQQSKITQPKYSSLSVAVLDAIIADMQQEGCTELVEAVRALPMFARTKKGSNKENADFASTLLALVRHVSESNTATEYMVLLKYLLGLWVRGTVVDFSAVGTERLLHSSAMLKTHSILGTADMRRIATCEELNEHARTFQCTPRILLTYGRPTKLSTYEVQGKVTGIVSCLSINDELGPQYFEVTLKGRDFAGLRVGWALCGADLGDCNGTGCSLGSTDEVWVFEGFNGHFYHNAKVLARSRRGPESADDADEGEGDAHDEDSLFAGLFNDEAGEGGDSGRGARLSRDSGMSSAGSEDTGSHAASQRFRSESATAGEGATAGPSAQAFLDLVREEDRGDVSSIRRFLMSRGLASQAQRIPGGAPFAGQEGLATAERAESRTSFGVLSDIATAAPSETSEHSAPSSVSGRERDASTPATLSRSAKEGRTRAAWREGGQALHLWDKSAPLSSNNQPSSDKQDTPEAEVHSYPWASGSTLGCLLLPTTGEVRYFLEGVCIGTAPDRIPLSLLSERGVCPVFYCTPTAGLEVNIGQAPLRFESEVVEHLQQNLTGGNRGVSALSRAAFTPLATARNPYITITAPGGEASGGGSGLLVERLQTEGYKSFTLECSFRLSESVMSAGSSDATSGKEGGQAVKSGELTPGGSGLFAESAPGTPAGAVRRYCLVCCGPKPDTTAENQSPTTDDVGCNFGVDSRGGLYLELQGGETVRTMSGLCRAGQWYHVGVTYVYHRSNSKATVTFFLNGVPVTQQELVSSKRTKLGRIFPRTLCIGSTFEPKKLSPARSAVSTRDAFAGDICEVRVWGAARSPERIAASTGRGKVSGVEPDLLAQFPMEEGYGRTVHDAAIVRNNVRSAEAVVMHGACSWGNAEARSDAELGDNHLVVACANPAALSAVAQSAVAAAEAAQQVDVTDVDETAVRSSNLTGLISALVTKLLYSSDVYMATYAQTSEGSPIKKLAEQLTSLKSVCDGSDVAFLLLNSLLRQLIGYLSQASLSNRGQAVALLTATTHAVLAVLRANLDCARGQLLEDGDQASWTSCGGGACSDTKVKMFSSLLVALLRLASGCAEDELEWVVALRSDAVATVMAGLDVFIPGRCNQFFALECLALKSSEDQRGPQQSSPFFHAAMNILLTHTEPVKHNAALPTDPLEALLTMSRPGDDALFAALSGVISAPSFVAHLVPEQHRPVVASATDTSAVFTIKNGHAPMCGVSVVPRPGDLVQRGPHWNRDNQDGGAGTLGVVMEVGSWTPTDSPHGSKVVVQWRNGTVNSYRYGAGPEPQFDVAVLRASAEATSAQQPLLPRTKGMRSPLSDDDGEEFVRIELAYTPEEVRVALEEEKGGGTITKRSVLSYIKETAPNEWQERNRLMKPVNALIVKMAPSDVSQVYSDFYATFSASSNRSASVGKVLRIEPRCAQRVAAAADADLPHRVERMCAHLLQRVSIVNRCGPSVHAAGEMQLLAAIHCLLLGTNSKADSAGVRIPALSDRVARGSFTTATGANSWDWRRGQWGARVAGTSQLPSPDPLPRLDSPTRLTLRDKAARLMGTGANSTSAKILADLSIDRNYLGRNMQVKNRLRSVEIVQSGDREWSTCICTTAMHPFTGVYKWYVRIKNFSERRGHCLIGVATADFSHDEFLGQHQESWGISPGLDLFHGGRKRRCEAERKLSVGSTVEVTLDTNKGTLTFTELNIDGSSAVIEPVGFENVRGVVVYPAFSLYSPGDCISIFTNAEDIGSLRMRDAAFRTPTKADFTQATPKPTTTVMLGAPQLAVMQYALQLVNTACNMLRGCSTGEDVLRAVQNPVVSVILPNLLGSLCKWKHVARAKAKHLSDALVQLLSRLRSATALLREHVPTEGDTVAAETKGVCDEVLVQLNTSVAAYLGRIATSWIKGSATEVDNESLSAEEQHTPAPAMLTVPPSPTSTAQASPTPVNWLSSALFAQGLRATPSADAFLKSAQLGDASFEDFICWLKVHDRTHKNFRRFGGETLDRPVRLLFAVSLYHSGYLHGASFLRDLYNEYASHFTGASEAARTEAQQAVKPPLFALHCWESAMKIRRWAKEVASTGMSYDFAAQRITQRCLFLLELEPSSPDQLFDRSTTQLAAWVASTTTVLDKQLSGVVSQVRRFVSDSCSLSYLRAAALTCGRSAELRRDGFRVIRAALGHISPDIGCAAKCAMVSELPSALKTPQTMAPSLFGLPAPVSSVAEKPRSGHYTQGLDAISQSLRMEMQGAFDAYFACLAEELAACNHGEDFAYQLCLLDCLGVRLLEQDHTMLSRVNFFFTLQEMLDGTLALQSHAAVSAEPRREDRETINPGDIVVKAAMKLFILMALQVATSRDEEREASSFTTSFASFADLQAPALRKIKSGPATLSKSVFDIVYSQLSEVSREVLSLAGRLTAQEHFVPTLYISPSAQMITSEAITLLLCVSRNTVCQKILLRPKWITLLLQMAILSVADCQQRALLLLSDLLGAMEPQALHLEHFDTSELPPAFAACWVPGAPLAAGVVSAVLVLIGQTMLHVDSHALVCTADADFIREITEIALPVMSEAVALVRHLHLAPAWAVTVERVLIAALQQDLSKSASYVQLIAALCVMGGQIDAPYRGCPVVFQNTTFGSSREPTVGVFHDYGDTPDKAQIACLRAADTPGATLLPSPTPQSYRSVLSGPAPSADRQDETHSMVVVPTDKVHAINRCPIEKFTYSERLVEELLKFFASVVLPGGLMERAARDVAQAEAKEETTVVESKTEGSDAVGAANSPEKGVVSSLVPSVHQLVATTSSRVLSVISERAASCDVLLAVLTRAPNCAEIMTTLLDEAQQPNKSGGLADLPVYEEYLMIALRQRQKLWATKRESTHTAEMAKRGGSSQAGAASPKSPFRTDSSAQPRSPFASRDAGSSGAPRGPGSSLPIPPPPFGEFSFSSGIPMDPNTAAESKSSDRSLSPFPPRAPVRPNTSTGGRRGGRGGMSRYRRWNIGNRDPQDDQYDFAEERGDEGDQMIVDSLAGMGFPPRWVEIALDMTGGDPEEALNYILSNTAQLEEMAASMDAEEEEARSMLAELTAAQQGEGQTEATPSVVEVQTTSADGAGAAAGATGTQQEASNVPDDPLSGILGTAESAKSEQGASVAHVDVEYPQLVPFYMEPSFSSERVGCLYPGDDFTVMEVRPDATDSANSWYKIPFADFDEGSYHQPQAHYGDDADEEVFVWAPRLLHGQEVIKEGPNESEMESEVLNPRGELLTIDRTYRIIGANGALVREGLEIDSSEVRSLSAGDVVHAYEETYNSDGTLRLHIDRPVHGWISKLFGLVSRVTETLPVLTVDVTNSGSQNSTKDTPGTHKSTEMELLEKVDDNMEFYSAVDTFNKEDRFFGSQQGSQYSRNRDREKLATQALHNRRMRVSGMNSMSGYSQGLMKQNVDAVDSIVHALLRTLQKLYCRRVLLALLVREGKKLADADAAQPAQRSRSVTAHAATAESVTKFYRFVRMLVFRGYPHTVTGLEHLRFSETVAAALEPGSVTVEQVFDAVVARLLEPEAGNATRESFRAEFVPLLVDSVAKNIRLASAAKFAEHVWADSSYEEDLDNDVVEQPNLHYAGWVTRLLLLLKDDDVSVSLFQCWAVGLRVTSMSMKLVVFSNLADILSAMRANALQMQSRHSSLVLQACLAMLPIQRLLTMGTKKLWAEMEDAPAFSRFLQAFLFFLSEIDLSKSVIDQEALDVSGEVSPVPNGPTMSPKPAEAPDMLTAVNGKRLCFLQERPVVHLKSQSSYVQLSPQKEIAGPWTVELWLRRGEAPTEQGDSAVTQESAQEEEEDHDDDDMLGVGGPGGLRRLSGLTEKLQGVIRSELMNSSERGGRDRLGLTGLLSLLLGTAPRGEDKKRRSGLPKPQAPQKPDPAGRVDLPGMVLLSSSKGAIKLQAGGKVFNHPSKAAEGSNAAAAAVDDPLQESDPVHEEAYCLSFAPGGGAEKRMDCVIPTGRWLHLAIVCQTAPLNLTTVYIDGEVQDSLSMSMNLPLSVLGANQPGTSFIGDVAEMRVWSHARSRLEIVRDLDRDVSGAKCLVSYLRCNEGRGRLTHDKAGIFNSCKLYNASWANVPAPALRPSPMPTFMLSEPEEAEGLFGADIGSGAQVTEMTGTIKVQSVMGAQGELANEISEVVCLVYRAVPSGNNGSVSGRTTPIEGYLNWCERDVRSKISGSITPSGTVQFSITGDSVILGPPESLEWLKGLRFEGTLVNDQLKGNFQLSTAVDTLPAVAPGSSRVDQLSLPPEIRYFASARAAFKAHLLVKENSPEGQYIATVEVAPYPKFEPDSGAHVVSPEVSPRPAASTAEVGAAQQVDSDLVAYGLCSHQGGLWVEWLVNTNSGNIAFGATTCDGLAHPDASVDANDDTWTYSISGQASHGSNLLLCDTAEEGDVISMHIDSDHGFVRFYKNYEFLVGFDDLNEHPKMNPAYQPPSESHITAGSEYSGHGSNSDTFQPGIRPFVSLVAVADSVSYMGLKAGNVEIIYPADDPLGRCRFAAHVVDGHIHGYGLLTVNANTEKWFGNWSRGVEDGLHIRVDDVLAPGTVSGKLYEAGRVVREIAAPGEEISDQSAALQIAYTEFIAQRHAAAVAETTAAAAAASISPAPRVSTPIPPAAASTAPSTTATPATAAPSAHMPTAAELLSNKITIVLHDTAGENSYFKIMRSVISKKLFAAYAAKRDCPVRTFIFKYNNVVIDGDSTIESNGIDNNATIEVTVNSINASTSSAAEIERYLEESTAPYVVQILYESGALVRSGVEIETNALRTLACGEIIECFKKAQSSEGVGRYRVADGWISEKLRGGNEARVVKLLSERMPRPVRYKVVREEGARIRRSPSLSSEDVGFCPLNTVLTASEVRYIYDSRDDNDQTVRVRIDSPAAWRGGWASVKDHILLKLPDSLSQDGTVLSEAEIAVQAEKDRRTRIRAQRKVKLEMLKSKEQAAKRRRRIVQTTGALDVSQETFFLLKRRRANDGAQVSADFTTVSCESSSCGRTMVIGSRGFSRGVHYWEVQVNAASWGSVFIGVAPHESSSWNGYGLLNYRATQAFGSETLYGSYFAVGDKVGVLLDMDHGTISFFKDGEDFNVGRTNVVNMGVAYHNLRRIGNRSSSSSMLYPCLGVKSSGDSLTIRKNHWVSSRGLAPSALLQRILQAKSVIHNWNAAYQPGINLDESLVEQMFQGYSSWTDREKVVILTRPGISVQICTSDAAIARVAGPLAEQFSLTAGKVVRTAYGEGKILGARHNQLWYSYNGGEQSAWYWRGDELKDLIDFAIVGFDVEEGEVAVATRRASVSSACAPPPVLTYEDFRAGISDAQWSRADDELITRTVNSIASKYDYDPQRIPASVVEAQLVMTGILPGKSSAAIHARYAALCVVNKAAAVALPFVDFNSGDLRLPLVGTALTQFDITKLSPTSRNAAANCAISQIKRVIFTQTKMKVWLYAIKESTTPTTAPADEYERPDDLREITINRVEARNAEKMKDSLSFQDKLRVSVFGQLMASMGAWDDRALRRAFVHMQDAGQSRAFFVKFSGEGVDDQGGPYRAVFQTAVGEEVSNLLDLLVPCPNALTETGDNRDKYLINPAVTSASTLAGAIIHLGKLVGIACRHNILVALSLPKIIWKPLAGEPVDVEDLQAVDVAEANALKTIAAGEMPQEQVQELLVQALTSALSARGLDTTVAHTLANEALTHAGTQPGAVRDVVQLVQQLRLTSQTDGLRLIYRGMSAVVPTELLPMFSADELESIFCGEAEVDIAVLQKATQYEAVSPADR